MNATGSEPSTLFDGVFAPERASRIAVLYDGRQLTYEELRAETVRAAQILAGLSLQAGDRVALLLHDSPEFIASFIAVQSLGAIAVPINMALSPADQHLILNDCGARIVVLEAEICSTLPTGGRASLHLLEHALIVRRENGAELPELAGLQTSPFTLSDQANEAQRSRRSFVSDPLQPSLILYTSGSTGIPKGAVHCQADVFYTNESFCRQVLGLQSGDRLFSSSRLPFAYGLGNSFSFPLLNGITTVLCREKPTPEVISRVFTEYRPTVFFSVPVVFKLLLERQRTSPLDCSSLRLCLSAGEALPAALGEEWQATFGIPVLDGIGSTEMLHMWMSNREDEVRYGSSGKLLDGYEARLLDANGEPTPLGEEGNLWVKGASAASGYWQRPEETARTFVDGWVRTGDLYRQDADGFWYHLGRSDDCFKSSGQWVSPVEVEGVLLRHPAVQRVAVVEDFDADDLPCPCAYIVCSDVESNSQEIEAALRVLTKDALPRFKQPRTYRFVSELPYTATGKIQRFKLRKQLREATKDSH
jgi:benzoate-CoA ligase